METTEKLESLVAKLSAAYNKARTKEDYEKVVIIGNEVVANMSGETSDMIVINALPAGWARYYYLLKFFSPEERKEGVTNLLGWIEGLLSSVEDPENKVALLYLKSVILSYLVGNQIDANWCIVSISKIISRKGVSIASTLELINASGIAEMSQKKWREAVNAFSEIERFQVKVLRQPENLRYAANILSNLGASYVRGDISIIDGKEYLLIARDYYLQEELPPKKHLEGIKNRLREAEEKL